MSNWHSLKADLEASQAMPARQWVKWSGTSGVLEGGGKGETPILLVVVMYHDLASKAIATSIRESHQNAYELRLVECGRQV